MATPPTIPSIAGPQPTKLTVSGGLPQPVSGPPVPVKIPTSTTPFGGGSWMTNAPPSVVTAKPAIADVQKKMDTVNVLDQQMTAPKMATVINPATGQRAAVPVNSEQAKAYFRSGFVLETPAAKTTTETTTTEKPKAEATITEPKPAEAGTAVSSTQAAQKKFDDDMAAVNAKSDQALADFNSKVEQIENGTFPLSPDEQAQIDNLKAQFNSMIEAQKTANANYEGAVRRAGIAAGRNMYAPEVELGNVQAAVNTGLAKINDLTIQMTQAVLAAKQAFQDKDYKRLQDQYKMISDLQEQKRQTIRDTYGQTKDLLAAAKQDHDQQMADQEFQFKVEVERNKPILEADARIQNTIADLIKSYPDSGITEEDTLATAQEKVRNSASFKAELAKKRAESVKATQGGAPIIRDTGRTDEFGTKIYEQYNPMTQHWEATTSDQLAASEAMKIKGTDTYSTSVSSALSNITAKDPIASHKQQTNIQVTNAYNQGNPRAVVGIIKNAAKDTMNANDQAMLNSSEIALVVLPKIKDDMVKFVEEGGSLNVFNGTINDIIGKLGTTTDPKLKALATELTTYFVDYRRAMTGVAFNAAESATYEAVMPNSKDTIDTAKAKIDGFLRTKDLMVNATYSNLVGSDNWNQLNKMNDYDNTIDRSEYNKLVETKGKAVADKMVQDAKAWIVDSPKVETSAAPTSADIKEVSVGKNKVSVATSIIPNLESAEKDFKAATGKDLEINQSFRTRAQQEKLYAELKPKGARVAKPGTSFHEKGMAIDVTNWKEAEPYLRKYGFRNDLADDKGHFSIGEFNA